MHPGNTTGTYTTELARRISLEGEGWTAALLEIQYPETIYNVLPGENTIELYYAKGVGTLKKTLDRKNREALNCVSIPAEDLDDYDIVYKVVRSETLSIEPDYYASAEALLAAINDCIAGKTKARRSYFHNIITSYGGHVQTDPFEEQEERDEEGVFPYKIVLSPSLMRQLGFSTPVFELCREPGLSSSGPVTPDLGRPPQMYIYCDVIAPQYVGHTLVPLLRTIPIASGNKYGGTTTHSVENPLYLPVATRAFSTLEINLKDHAGRAIPFTFGQSSALVHFRKGN